MQAAMHSLCWLAIAFGLCCAVQAQDTSPAGDPAFDGRVQQSAQPDVPIVVLRTLDKVTARIKEISIKVGETARFGTLEITASYCRSTPPIETPETYAHLTIVERGLRTNQLNQVFSGWMLKSSPALSPMEHSVYDVWVIACKTASGVAFTGSDHQSQ